MAAAHKWSQDVTEHSNALDLERDVFTRDDPKSIALSLKRFAEHSHRRKGSPFQSAMSMLTFYINRAGKDLPAKQKKVLEKAKSELRAAFGR
jgi:translation initiation factor 2 alpha subunit (eIF-2alpha)